MRGRFENTARAQDWRRLFVKISVNLISFALYFTCAPGIRPIPSTRRQSWGPDLRGGVRGSTWLAHGMRGWGWGRGLQASELTISHVANVVHAILHHERHVLRHAQCDGWCEGRRLGKHVQVAKRKGERHVLLELDCHRFQGLRNVRKIRDVQDAMCARVGKKLNNKNAPCRSTRACARSWWPCQDRRPLRIARPPSIRK